MLFFGQQSFTILFAPAEFFDCFSPRPAQKSQAAAPQPQLLPKRRRTRCRAHSIYVHYISCVRARNADLRIGAALNQREGDGDLDVSDQILDDASFEAASKESGTKLREIPGCTANECTMDFFDCQTTPSALGAWSSAWTVGGITHRGIDAMHFPGQMHFARAPFYSLRLSQGSTPDTFEDFLFRRPIASSVATREIILNSTIGRQNKQAGTGTCLQWSMDRSRQTAQNQQVSFRCIRTLIRWTRPGACHACSRP